MKNIYIITLLITFIYSSVTAQSSGSRSSNNYVILNDHTKLNDQNTTANLIQKTDSICLAMPLIDNETFKVYSSTSYPILGAVDPEFGLSQSIAITLNQLAQESYYLGIIKSCKNKGNESLNQKWETEYLVKIDFPLEEPEFQNIQPLEVLALENHVSSAINNYITNHPNQNIKTLMDEAEIEGLRIFYYYYRKLQNNETLPDLLKNAGFFVHELNHDRSMSRSSETLITEYSSDNKFTVHNYGGYNIVPGGNLIDFLSNSTILHDKSQFSYVFIISARNDFQNLENINTQFKNSTATFKIWIHIDYMIENSPNAKGDQIGSRSTFTDKIYVKMENSLTDAETDEILDNMYEESMQTWTEKKVESSPQGCGNFSWQYGWNCVYPYAQSSSDLIYNSNLALGCGFLDGFLGTLEGFYNMGKTAGAFWSEAQSFMNHLIRNGVDFEAMANKFYQTISSGYKALIEFAEEVKELGVAVYDFFQTNDYTSIMNMVTCMVDNILIALDAFDAESIAVFLAYNIGMIAMEGVLTALVPIGAVKGAGLFKPLVNIIKLKNPNSISDFLVDKFTKGTTFVKCKILRLGCFIKDTPVLMASNPFRTTAAAYVLAAMPVAVPIQDVQLLDYAVAHKTVNSSYGLTASSEDTYIIGNDPYTSDQQRSRDQYEINDTDWYEVAFEELNGSSSCKLALHNDWITNHSYVVDGIVNMNLPEQGISGLFKITSIKHIIPQKKPVDEDLNDEWGYRPVTGLFTHHSDAVLNITFSNSETLGVTAPHPIFSTTHNDWRLAGELEVGEKVLAYHGEATVTKTEKKAGSEKVYNLEIKDLHNFLVGDVGVVVHNACARSILGDDLYNDLKQIYKNAGYSADEIDELLEESAQVFKDLAIENGEKVKKGISAALKQAAKNFEEFVLDEFINALLADNIDPNTVVEQVTLNVNGENVVFDYVALDKDGQSLHFGEAKYSESDKDWINDWKSSTTPHQTNQFEKLNNPNSIIEVRCSKPSKCQDIFTKLKLSHKQNILPNKVKSLTLFGSVAKTKSVKSIKRII